MARIRFENRHGTGLVGDLELPAGGRWHATVLFAHCFTCGRNLKGAREISRALADAGCAVLRFDFTGIGESEGDFSQTSFTSNLDDLEDAAKWLARKLAAPQLLVGHSLGGTAALAVAERLDSVRAVATIGAPARADHVLKRFGDDGLREIEEHGSAEIELAGRTFRIRRDFVEDARDHDLEERLDRLGRALLIMHSPVDREVGIDEAAGIFDAALHPKSFVSLDHADHLLSDPGDARYAAQVIAAWGRRYLELAEDAVEDADAVVDGRAEDDFLCLVRAGVHRLTADEPQPRGGTDRGPDPYQYLAAALASCTVMTLNLYAHEKDWPLEHVRCSVSHDRVHADDCADCASQSGRADRLTRRLVLWGDLDPKQRERLAEIAERCPVSRTLENEIRIVTERDDPD